VIIFILHQFATHTKLADSPGISHEKICFVFSSVKCDLRYGVAPAGGCVPQAQTRFFISACVKSLFSPRSPRRFNLFDSCWKRGA
jgi:hypothetical protein